MGFKIPKRFKQFGHTITVEHDDNLIEDSDNVGEAHYRTNEIVLQSPTGTYAGRPSSYYEEVFTHELFHWMLHLSGYENNNTDFDHKFIDIMSNLLYQFLTTAEYDDEKSS